MGVSKSGHSVEKGLWEWIGLLSSGQTISLYGAQWYAKSCFSMGMQLSAADGMTVLQNPKGLCHDSSSRLAITSALNLFPSLIPPWSAGSYGPNVNQGCLHWSLALSQSPFLFSALFKAGLLLWHVSQSIIPSCRMCWSQKQKRPRKYLLPSLW